MQYGQSDHIEFQKFLICRFGVSPISEARKNHIVEISEGDRNLGGPHLVQLGTVCHRSFGWANTVFLELTMPFWHNEEFQWNSGIWDIFQQPATICAPLPAEVGTHQPDRRLSLAGAA
jgi:hypothetical protein